MRTVAKCSTLLGVHTRWEIESALYKLGLEHCPVQLQRCL